VSCGAGQCIDRNGEPVCACDAGAAATASLTAAAPSCAPVTSLSGSPGAQDFSEELRGLKVCAPRPPACGPDGWLQKVGTVNPGVDCGDSQPDPALTREPPAPTCPGIFSCDGCDTPGSTAPIGGIAGAWLVALVVLRRRRA
jgi:MYXO-CTERM domain-containing protein